MAESLINTKRRINTIKSTEKITKAMKLVASVKFQRWKRYYEDNKAYSSGISDTMKYTLESADLASLIQNHPCLMKNNATKKLYIVVTSTLGLCGSYNYNLYRELDQVLTGEDELLFIGQKGFVHYKDKGYSHMDDYLSLLDTEFSFGKVKALRHYLIRLYKQGEYQSINLIYTHYKNSMTFVPTIKQLIPINIEDFQLSEKTEPSNNPPLFDPDIDSILTELLPHYIDSEMYTKIMEAELSELASRRNAMETATDSADKIVSKLMITYNKTRQNAITQEITEVVAGANAGKKDEE